MALDKDTLASNLESMTPVGTEAKGNANFADAFTDYFYGAEVKAVPVVDGTLAGANSAMKAAMVGINSGGGWGSLVAGISAFWSFLSANAVIVWVVVPPIASITPPPGISTLAAALAVTGQANIAGQKSLSDSVAAIAADIHAATLGGLAVDTTAPTPISNPIT